MLCMPGFSGIKKPAIMVLTINNTPSHFHHIFLKDIFICYQSRQRYGNSKNVISALKLGQEIGCKTVGLTGRDGGHEIDLRQFALEGMQLYGSLNNIKDNSLQFKPNLKHNLDRADDVYESIKRTIDDYINKNDIDAPLESPYEPVWQPEAEVLELDYRANNITSVIWCIGYKTNFGWVDVPVFDGKGYPNHDRGVTSVRGLYFIGLPWLYTWGSGRFSGVARDAEYLSDYVAKRTKYAYPGTLLAVNEAAIGS